MSQTSEKWPGTDLRVLLLRNDEIGPVVAAFADIMEKIQEVWCSTPPHARTQSHRAERRSTPPGFLAKPERVVLRALLALAGSTRGCPRLSGAGGASCAAEQPRYRRPSVLAPPLPRFLTLASGVRVRLAPRDMTPCTRHAVASMLQREAGALDAIMISSGAALKIRDEPPARG